MKRIRIIGSALLLFMLLLNTAAPFSASAVFIPDLDLDLALPTLWIPPAATATPKLFTLLPIPIPPFDFPKDPTETPAATPKPTPKPTPKQTKKPAKATPNPTEAPKAGSVMTGEGPLFLSFRNDLTDQYWMFTPIDLSLEGQFNYPLVAGARHVVGEVKVEVQSGMAVVSYMLAGGVVADTEREFFTFFPDIASVTSVDPAALQEVKLAFNIPYQVTSRLNTDPNVLLYINIPVSYDENLSGIKGFSFQDEGYLARLSELYPLME